MYINDALNGPNFHQSCTYEEQIIDFSTIFPWCQVCHHRPRSPRCGAWMSRLSWRFVLELDCRKKRFWWMFFPLFWRCFFGVCFSLFLFFPSIFLEVLICNEVKWGFNSSQNCDSRAANLAKSGFEPGNRISQRGTNTCALWSSNTDMENHFFNRMNR